MARDISVSIAVNGEREFSRALKEAQSAVKVLDSELKASEAAYANSGDAQAHLAQRLSILNSQLRQQDVIVGALGQAVEDSAKEFGDAARQTDRYRIALNEATARAERMKTAIAEANREADEMGRDSARIGRQMEQGIGEAAEDVSDKIERMAEALDRDLGEIGRSVDFSAIKDGFDLVTGAVSNVYGAIENVTEGTAEYRRTMGYLEANALSANMDAQTIKDYAFEVAALTGELDGAVEGMSNLLEADLEAEELATAVERLSEAVVRFPDTLKFESLADSLQESIATGSAVGQYAEYLERMGADLTTVQESFEEAKKSGQEAVEAVALAWLKDEDGAKALETYREINKALLEGQEAQLKWNDEVARTSEILQPLVTNLTNFKTEVLGIFNDIAEGTETIGGEDADAFWDSYKRKQSGRIGEEEIGVFEGFAEGVKATATELKESIGGLFDGLFQGDELKQQGKNAGAEGMAGVNEGLDENAAIAEANANVIGGNIGTEVGNGIASRIDYVASRAAEMYDAAAAQLNRPIAGPVVGMGSATSYGGQGGNTKIGVDISIDGRSLARSTSEYTSSEFARAAARAEEY